MSGISGICTDEDDGDGHLDLHYPKSQVNNLAVCTIAGESIDFGQHASKYTYTV